MNFFRDNQERKMSELITFRPRRRRIQTPMNGNSAPTNGRLRRAARATGSALRTAAKYTGRGLKAGAIGTAGLVGGAVGVAGMGAATAGTIAAAPFAALYLGGRAIKQRYNKKKNESNMAENGFLKKTGRGALKLLGPTQNNNANTARRTQLRTALEKYVGAKTHTNYITAARALNALLSEPTRNNREYKNGLGVMRVTSGTTAANIRRAINSRLQINRTQFLKAALINTNVTNQTLKNVFGSNVDLSYRIYSSRFQTNLNSARTLNNLNRLAAAIPRNHPGTDNFRQRIANKRNQLKAQNKEVQTGAGPNGNGNKGPKGNGNKGPKGNGNGNKGPKGNGNGNKGSTRNTGSGATATGIGKLKIQIGTGNSNLRKRLENLERAKNASERAKANAKSANAKANANPGNTNAARANANAARAELEAVKAELEALKTAATAAETAKATLQEQLVAAQATGANVEGLRRQLANTQAAASQLKSQMGRQIANAKAKAARANANAARARTNAVSAKERANASEATVAEHLAARQAAERSAHEASTAAATAQAEKAALNTQYALAQARINAVTANTQATAAERNAARANAAAARARAKEANARARTAEEARLSATAAATKAMQNATAQVNSIKRQLTNATQKAEANAAKIARLTAQGANTSALNAARANAVRHAAEANRLRRELTTASTGGLIRSSVGFAYGAGSMLAAGLRKGTNVLFGAVPVQATVSLQRNAPAINRNAENAKRRQAAAEARAQYSSSSLIRGKDELQTNIAGSKFIKPPKLNLKPYRNRYNQAMGYGNNALKLSGLTQLQRNLRGFTPNASSVSNKRKLSENINTALRQLETLGERTQRYTAYATGVTPGPAPSQNVWRNVFGR